MRGEEERRDNGEGGEKRGYEKDFVTIEIGRLRISVHTIITDGNTQTTTN